MGGIIHSVLTTEDDIIIPFWLRSFMTLQEVNTQNEELAEIGDHNDLVGAITILQAEGEVNVAGGGNCGLMSRSSMKRKR